MADVEKLIVELAAGHPDTGAYNANAVTAAGELNAINRPAVAGITALRNYFLLERKGSMALMGRLEFVAGSAVGAVDPLGDVVTLGLAHITAAKTLLNILNAASDFSLDLNDSRFGALLDDLAAAGAKVIAPADKTALLALSTNQQSRASEIGVSFVKAGHVLEARL